MLTSDAELVRRGILLIEHIADLVQPIQTIMEIPSLEADHKTLLAHSRERLERIINAANSIED